MKYGLLICCAFVCSNIVLAGEPLKLEPDKLGDVLIPLTDEKLSAVELQTPIPSILSVRFATGTESIPYLVFNGDATKAKLEFSKTAEPAEKRSLLIESAEKSGQQPDGRIFFTAADSKVEGSIAKLESHPGNDRIGFWTNLDDRVVWDYEATRPGTYSAEITYSLDGESESEVNLEFGESTLSKKLRGTGSWYRYRTLEVGTIKIPAQGNYSLAVSGTRKTGAALMNLKSVVLRPAPEGKPIVQQESGEIVCHARDVTIHGIKVQYEPRPEKNTVGYWIHPEDTVSWDFKVNKPGEFDVEVLQGCGKGHGGSEVSVLVDGQKLEFEVEDTGHFQNFKPRVIGRVKLAERGSSTLAIIPIKKASVAVMDVRQVRLIPVK
ncbi:MAG TPA: hypothetical protein VLA12_08615 [Planctomycetaceae bacterium]|nr:hypothetical protein [Planctomycetaceae bacterium]